MNNPLFNMMNGGQALNPIVARLRMFQNSFKGDARAEIQQLMNSGKISQSQYDQAVQMANQIQRMISGR